MKGRHPRSPLHRLYDRVVMGHNGCHVCTYRVKSHGYCEVNVPNEGHKMAHRVAWELFVGPIPESLTIDHMCLNKRCVNILHMRLMTRAANTSDARRRAIRNKEGNLTDVV